MLSLQVHTPVDVKGFDGCIQAASDQAQFRYPLHLGDPVIVLFVKVDVVLRSRHMHLAVATTLLHCKHAALKPASAACLPACRPGIAPAA